MKHKKAASVRKRNYRPTEAEMAILQILWERGPSTVREVHESLSPREEKAYTTTLKLMQIMQEKGLVKRDTSNRSHVYQAVITRDQVSKSLLDNMIEAVFKGSPKQLILEALGRYRPSREELESIRQYIDQMMQQKRSS